MKDVDTGGWERTCFEWILVKGIIIKFYSDDSVQWERYFIKISYQSSYQNKRGESIKRGPSFGCRACQWDNWLVLLFFIINAKHFLTCKHSYFADILLEAGNMMSWTIVSLNFKGSWELGKTAISIFVYHCSLLNQPCLNQFCIPCPVSTNIKREKSKGIELWDQLKFQSNS